MKLHYDQETDSLYIDLSDSPSATSKEVSDDVVIDFGDAGQIVGFDIQHASRHLDLSRIETTHLPTPAAAA